MAELQKRPEALLFDLDGTLAHTVPALAAAARATAAELKINPPDTDTTAHYVGNGIMVLLERVMEGRFDVDMSHIDPERLHKARAIFNRHYLNGLGAGFTLYPGVREALSEFRDLRIKLAVVTNKPQMFTLPLLGHMGLADCFDYVLAGEVLPVRKPDPLPIRHTLEKLGVAPERALMVGDSDNDIYAGQRAGVATVFFTFGYYYGDGAGLNPTFIFDSYEELRALIRAAQP